VKLTAIILTKNEEKNIERCLRSVDFCDEVIIVDDKIKLSIESRKSLTLRVLGTLRIFKSLKEN